MEKALNSEPTSCKVIHIRDWTKSANQIYIGRAGKGQDGYFGNPSVKGQTCVICSQVHIKGGDTLSCFRLYFNRRIVQDNDFLQAILSLRDKELVCFCKPKDGFTSDIICHGQIIKEFLEMYYASI